MKNKVLYCISTDSFFPPPARSKRGLFPNIFCGNVVELLEANLTVLWGPLWLGPLEFLSLRIVPHEPPAILQMQFRSSFLALAPVQFLLVSLCSVKSRFPILVLASSLGDSGLPFVLPYLRDPRRAVAFSVWLWFCLLQWSDNFQGSYLWNWKLEVTVVFNFIDFCF